MLDRSLERIPIIRIYYAKRAARMKRGCCLLLNKMGLLKPFSFVQWLATYRCNFSCTYCEASAGKAVENELTTIEVKRLIEDLAEMGVKRFVISGGEPLMRPDIIEVMRYANLKKMMLGLVTNGYLVEDMWDELRDLDYFFYFTSVDGLPEQNDRMRGKENAFQRAMRGLELFRTLGVRTRMINTVVHPGNIGHLAELLGVLRQSAANVWHLAPVTNVGRAADDPACRLDGPQLHYLLGFIRANKSALRIDLGESHAYLGCLDGRFVGKPFFCGAGLTRCSVMPDGEVLGCQQVYDSAFSEGNVRHKPLSRIWKEGFGRFREKAFHEHCDRCEFLDACQGGCWAEMVTQNACLKSVWEKGK